MLRSGPTKRSALRRALPVNLPHSVKGEWILPAQHALIGPSFMRLLAVHPAWTRRSNLGANIGVVKRQPSLLSLSNDSIRV